MRAVLPILSFLSAALITALVILRRLRLNTSNVSIVFWLLVCSVIHAVNTLVWAGNVEPHISLWCDIVTKLQLAAIIALPAACLCICYHLEMVSSTRILSFDASNTRRMKLAEMGLCVVLPIVYMAIHSIAQDHRFDLVEDFGCFASVNSSIPGLLIVWFPPLLLCSISFVYSGFIIFNVLQRQAESSFSSYISSRHIDISAGLFIRYFFTSTIFPLLIFILLIFFVASPATESWISFAAVHAHFYDIQIVTSSQGRSEAKLMWWIIPVLSAIYFLAWITSIDELRKVVRWLSANILGRPTRSKLPLLPVKNHTTVPVSSTSSFFDFDLPPTINLTSGWDEMLKSKTTKKVGGKPKSRRTSYHSPPSPSASSATSSEWQLPKTPDDDAFATSTLNYLGSGVAQTLGLPSPVSPPPPPPVYNSKTYIPDRPVKVNSGPTSPVHVPQNLNPMDARQGSKVIPEDAVSTISSIFRTAWPEPPSVMPSRTNLSPVASMASRTHTHTRSSSGDSFGYPLYPIMTSPHRHPQPFQDSDAPAPDILPKPLSKRPSRRELRRSGSRDGHIFPPGDVIYMTVVKEVD